MKTFWAACAGAFAVIAVVQAFLDAPWWTLVDTACAGFYLYLATRKSGDPA